MNIRQLTVFFVLTFVFSWFFWGGSLLDARGILTLPFSRGIFRIAGAFGPSVVGFLMLVKYKQKSLKSLLKNTFCLPWNKTIYFLAFLLMPLIYFSTYLFTSLVLDARYALEAFETPYLIPVIYLYILVLGGPLAEEIGWRGYALPEMMKRFSPFTASIVLGLVWSIWHMPLFFTPGSTQATIPFVPYLINTTLLSIIFTLLYVKSKGRISSALYFHSSANFALGIFYVIDEIEGIIVYSALYILMLTYLVYTNKKIFFNKSGSNSDSVREDIKA